MIKYSVDITGLGAEACMFLDESPSFIIIFNNDAPPELADISVLHTKGELLADPEVGDTLTICGSSFEITAVGWEALVTLRELGHCTLSFNGATEAERPGMIELKGTAVTEQQLTAGGKIEIISKD